MEKIIDKYLDDWVAHGFNRSSLKVNDEMADPTQSKTESARIWNPIASKVTDDEIAEFQSRLGHLLPPSYIRFLKHKHFYELFIFPCSFCPHPVRTWRDHLSAMIFDGWPRELVLDKGWIPFADWADLGMLCFDTTAPCKDNNYPIVFWDHEFPDTVVFQSVDFESLLFELDQENIKSHS